MQFRVIPTRSIDLSIPPEALVLPPSVALPEGGIVRQLSLNEAESRTVLVDGHPGHGHRKHQPANLKLACDDPAAVPFGPTMALLGTVAPGGEVNPLRWTEAITETPAPGATEVWEIHNFTQDAHPIHIHMVQFEVVGREAEGVVRPPEAWERGTKDTVISHPGESRG